MPLHAAGGHAAESQELTPTKPTSNQNAQNAACATVMPSVEVTGDE